MELVGSIRYFMEPAILWLAGMVMGEVGAHKIFTEPALLGFSSLPRVLVHEVGYFEIQVGRKRPCTKMFTLVFLNQLFKTFQRKYMVT